MTNYTQTAGSADGSKYFQDVALSPTTVADGTLRMRLDTRDFPKVGKKFGLPTPTVTSISPASSVDATTLDVTIVGENLERGATVAFSGTGITVNSVRRSGQKGRGLVANVTIADGATVAARNVTVTNPDAGAVVATAGFAVV